jgi:predicted nuclease of predicted toxin-antitoxin system
VALWLRELQHDVVSVYHEARGLDDDRVLQRAIAEDRILITNDKDFGEMIFREGKFHQGIVLLRLEDERPSNKIRILERLLDQCADELAGNFIVATERTVRIVHLRSG